jgi:hypothetical protein
MQHRTTSRLTAGLGAAVTTIALVAGPAAAAPNEGPDAFDSIASGTGLSIQVALPPTLADALAPVLGALPGITLDGANLDIALAQTLSELELPLTASGLGEVSSTASATSVSGSIQGFIETLTGGPVQCLATPFAVSIPEGATTPLVAFDLLQAECTTDAAGRLSIASSKIADLEVNLAGALELINTIPGGAEISDTLTGTVDTLTDIVENDVFPVIGGVLDPVEDAVNGATNLGLDLNEVLRAPEVFDVPLVSIKLLETVSTTETAGDLVKAVSSTTIAGVQLIGTVCLPDVTYRAESFTNGQPGGASYATSIPTIDVGICDTTLLETILRLEEAEGVINDILVNVGSGELRPLAEVLADVNSDLPLADILAGIEDLLTTLGVTSIVQGSVSEPYAAEDGSEARVNVAPFRIGVQPFGQLAAGTELETVGVMISGGRQQTGVQAAGIVQPAEPAAAPAPDAPVNMPKTGGGAAAALIGVLAMGSAALLRKRS